MATTFNPSDKNSNITLSNGNLTVVSNDGFTGNVRSIASYSSGKFYCQATIGASNTSSYVRGVGFGNASASLSNGIGSPDTDSGSLYTNDANFYFMGSSAGSTGISITVNDVIDMAVDLDNDKIWYRQNNGNWNSNGAHDPAANAGGFSISGLTKPIFVMAQSVADITFNFGDTAYANTPPSGFGNWGAAAAAKTPYNPWPQAAPVLAQ